MDRSWSGEVFQRFLHEGYTRSSGDLDTLSWMPLDSTFSANTYPTVPDNSRRAIQNQIRKWDFPSKQHNPVYQNEELIARVTQLWEAGQSHREMHRILVEEGFDIGEKELQRLRTKHNLLLRNPNGDKARLPTTYPSHPSASPIQAFPSAAILEAATSLDAPSMAPSQSTVYHDEGTPSPAGDDAISPPAEVHSGPSDKGKRRRRRVRSWNGHPADPAGPPRYASETTLEQAKQDLGLDPAAYQTTRETFQRLCAGNGILRKKDAGDGLWDSVQERLVQEVPALQDPAGDASPEEVRRKRKVALNAICHDVMKRMRGEETRMTVTEAKRVLGLNPTRMKEVRTAFRDIVEREGAGVACKSKAGADVWDGWVEMWMRESEIIGRVLAGADGPDGRQLKKRALDTVATDVMKRVRDVRKKEKVQGGESPADGALADHTMADEETASSLGESPALLSGNQGTQASSPEIHDPVDTPDRMPSMMAGYGHLSPIPAMPTMPGMPAMPAMASITSMTSMLSNPASDAMHMPAAMGLHTQGSVNSNPVGSSTLVSGGHDQHPLMSPLALDTQAGMALDPGLNPQMFLGSPPTPSFVDNQFDSQFTVSPSASVFSPQSHLQHHHSHSHSHSHAHPHPHSHPVNTMPAIQSIQRSPQATGVGVYLRPHRNSQYVSTANMCIAMLEENFTLEDLRQAACDKYGAEMCVGVGGVCKDDKGRECLVRIEADQELAAYLELLGIQGTPTFEVQMVGVRWSSGLQ